MKRLAIIFCILCTSLFILWKRNNKKYNNIDDDMENDDDDDEYDFVPDITGPKGERVFIGAGGGRYYTKDSSDMYAGFSR